MINRLSTLKEYTWTTPNPFFILLDHFTPACVF
ncbi:hypothetical protein NC652_028520 [Populus alba x Populus x berolinensis]|nr:hypothetical protein NC652_028520 [Populus alba x Populus x berolinensis]